MEPSIKGFAMRPTVRRLNQLMETDGAARAAVSDLLDAEDLALLEQAPLLTLWYPVARQGNLLGVLRELLGGGDDAVLTFAHESAEEVLQSPALRVLFAGAGRITTKLGPALTRMARFGFSFGDWRFEGDDLTDFRIIASEMEPMPDDVRLNVQGFIEFLASSISGRTVRCQSTRESPGRIVYRASTVEG